MVQRIIVKLITESWWKIVYFPFSKLALFVKPRFVEVILIDYYWGDRIIDTSDTVQLKVHKNQV